MMSPVFKNRFLDAGDGVTGFYKMNFRVNTKEQHISQNLKWLYSVVESRVHTRHEVSNTDPNLYKCAYFVKKSYLVSRGACGGGRLAGIFFPFHFGAFNYFF